MRRWPFIFLAAAVVGCAEKESAAPIMEADGPKHPVTAKMKDVAERLAAKPAPAFSGKDAAGKTYSLADLLKKGPVLLYSIKDGCPCSTDFEPFANALAKRYSGAASVVGVFDQPAEKAIVWSKDHSTAHPILVDPSLGIVKSYKLERSVYIALIKPDATVEKSWPGYSKSILLEVDGRLQKLTGEKLGAFDTMYAPAVEASGCQIFEGEGFAPGDVR